ncbi:Uncharacterized protein TPAR_02231 [Tolypocladium paradoxum]|uniref:F-box domain-containing protein n=1 Tax=Tolypocladium paradoxum TaxID=94208 RepID=A0A2S4L5A3_9HYPO|nr:Uncharacterized protein TPAR_02231 [Tolypocladium paradoxum]
MRCGYGAKPETTVVLDLPWDILRSLLELLAPQHLLALCLVNKAFRAIAEPYLYAQVEWSWEWEWKPVATPPIIPLLRTIIRRPELGSHVRALICHGASFYGPPFSGKLPPNIPVDESFIDQAKSVVGKVRVSFGDLWLQRLRSGTMDAYITLLLTQLPHLTQLHMHPSFTKESQLFGMMLRSSLVNASNQSMFPFLQRLQNIIFIHKVDHVQGTRNRIINNTSDVLPLFYLTSLEKMSASVSNPEAFVWPYDMPPDASALTSLDLSTIREGCLGHILKATTSLTSLRWKWLYDPNTQDEYNTPTINLEKIFEDISHTRSTLAELRIEAENYPALGEGDLRSLRLHGSCGPLTAFDRLKVLEAPQLFLLGFTEHRTEQLANVLPRNIQHLAISDDLTLLDEMEGYDRDLLNAIRVWLETSKPCMPQLCSIRLVLRESDMEWGPSMRLELKELCIAAGMELDVCLPPLGAQGNWLSGKTPLPLLSDSHHVLPLDTAEGATRGNGHWREGLGDQTSSASLLCRTVPELLAGASREPQPTTGPRGHQSDVAVLEQTREALHVTARFGDCRQPTASGLNFANTDVASSSEPVSRAPLEQPALSSTKSIMVNASSSLQSGQASM